MVNVKNNNTDLRYVHIQLMNKRFYDQLYLLYNYNLLDKVYATKTDMMYLNIGKKQLKYFMER